MDSVSHKNDILCGSKSFLNPLITKSTCFNVDENAITGFFLKDSFVNIFNSFLCTP